MSLPTIFKCIECDETFHKKYNLTRHIVRKHQYCQETINGNEATKNTNEETKNTNEIHKCHSCCKEFTRNWYLTKHVEKCKGIRNKLQCEYCEKTFKHENSRFYHYKRCEKKKETASDPPKIANTVSQNMTATHRGVINNQVDNSVDNSVNNNIIIVYNPNGNTPFIKDY